MSEPRSRDPVGITLVAVLLALLVSAWVFGMSSERPAPSGPGPVFMGLFLLLLGAMFAASYFLSGNSPVFRWLLAFASGFPFAKSHKMAFLFSLVCILSGVGAIADGLGIRFL